MPVCNEEVQLPITAAVQAKETSSETCPRALALDLQCKVPPNLRIARVRMAMLRIGPSTVSSAVSTVVASAVLFFCTIVVFFKLAMVLIAVTVLSIFGALVVLPAVLALAGPSKDIWYKRIPKRFLASLLHGFRQARHKYQSYKNSLERAMGG